MYIWFLLLIPIAIVIASSILFPKKFVLKEAIISLFIGVVLVLLAKLTAGAVTGLDTEYWGGWIVQAEYYEAWNERVDCQHDEYCTRTVSYRKSDGSQGTRTEEYVCGTQHMYDVDEHPPSWSILTSNGRRLSISSGRYSQLKEIFDNEQFVDMRRSYHTRDGDQYVTRWNGNDKDIQLVVTEHKYKNKVEASDGTIFDFKDVTDIEKETYGLYDYPNLEGHYVESVLGKAPKWGLANRTLDVANAKLGASKQVRMWVLLFEDQPLEAGVLQESLWKRGNKNEFVVCVGYKDKRIDWVHVFSWTDREVMKVRTRRRISEMGTLDLPKISDIVVEEVSKDWSRKEFKEFDYLTVNPPTSVIVVAAIILIILNALVSFMFIKLDW